MVIIFRLRPENHKYLSWDDDNLYRFMVHDNFVNSDLTEKCAEWLEFQNDEGDFCESCEVEIFNTYTKEISKVYVYTEPSVTYDAAIQPK